MDLEVTRPTGDFNFMPIVVGVFLALAGLGGFFFYRWRRQPLLATTDAQTVVVPEAALSIPVATGLPLAIDFPQIEPPFPDVWGLGEPLDIACRLTNPDGAPLTGERLEVSANSQPIGEPVTDQRGIAQLQYTFAEKGEHKLTASSTARPGVPAASVVRTLRIVDYREEIVSLYKLLVDWLRKIGLDIADTATPRDIERVVLGSQRGIPADGLDLAITCFEEADYSLHPVSRRDYQTMYLAQKEIRQHGKNP